jgi:hypothetical protein
VVYRHRSEATDRATPVEFAMSVYVDIGQGAGLASATGVQPFLPTLLTGALARGDVGIDFDGTHWRFLEDPIFLLVVFGLALFWYGAERSALNQAGGATGGQRRALDVSKALIGLTLGALLFAGTFAEAGHRAWPALLGGLACAALAWIAVGGLFDRARRRLEDEAVGLLTIYLEGTALLLAAIAIAAPPLALLALPVFLVLLVRGRREEGRKYAGLRVLR